MHGWQRVLPSDAEPPAACQAVHPVCVVTAVLTAASSTLSHDCSNCLLLFGLPHALPVCPYACLPCCPSPPARTLTYPKTGAVGFGPMTYAPPTCLYMVAFRHKLYTTFVFWLQLPTSFTPIHDC